MGRFCLTDEQCLEAVSMVAQHGSRAAAARALGIDRDTLRRRLDTALERGLCGQSDVIGSSPKITRTSQPKPPAPPPEPAEPAEVVALQRKLTAAEDELKRTRVLLKEAHRESLDLDAILAALGVMGSAPANPPGWAIQAQPKSRGRTPEVPVTMWADWHIGEMVARDEVNGVNEYSPEIAEERVHRLVESTINVAENHGPGVYPGVIVNLAGDFVSGALHPELAKTDVEEVIPAALRARDLMVWGLRQMADRFGTVYAPAVSGNHGRNTLRPEFKRTVYNNFDWLIYQLLIREFANDPRITIDTRPSNEVLYRVYGQRYNLVHGDMLGVKGGDGIIGVIGPIMRGTFKTKNQAAVMGRDFDVLLMGHYHHPLWLAQAIVANTLKGFDEFAKNALRVPPTEPSQPLWFVHPQRGITSRWDIKVQGKPAPAREWLSIEALMES